jgi:hypothetical protein
MTELYVVHGVWASNLDRPEYKDDWDVWLTDSKEEAQRIAEALGAAGKLIQVRPLVPSEYFDAQYALNPGRGEDWESYVGPRVDDASIRLANRAAGLTPPPRREGPAPTWVRQDPQGP